MTSPRLDGRAAVVTGAAAGIGRAIARRLAAEGAPVGVADVDAGRAAETVRQVREAGGTAEAFSVDLASTDSISALVEAAVARFGRVQILVNDAGVNGSLSLLEVTPEEWDRVLGINARGTFFCLQAFARHMGDSGGGRIISISSIAAKGFRRSGSVAYAASKSAVIAMTRFAALHLGPHGINVNAVCSGPTRSDAFLATVHRFDAGLSMHIDEPLKVFTV